MEDPGACLAVAATPRDLSRAQDCPLGGGAALHVTITFEPLEIPDVLLIEGTRHSDPRGSFEETFRTSTFRRGGLDASFVQDNHAWSRGGVLRGLHFQAPPHAQGKLVRCLSGDIFDVAVDIRIQSPTYGRWTGVRLSGDDTKMLWVPIGFAHGYAVLSAEATVAYKVTSEYAPESEGGLRWDDPEVGVEWPVSASLVSEADASLPSLSDLVSPFTAEP